MAMSMFNLNQYKTGLERFNLDKGFIELCNFEDKERGRVYNRKALFVSGIRDSLCNVDGENPHGERMSRYGIEKSLDSYGERIWKDMDNIDIQMGLQMRELSEGLYTRCFNGVNGVKQAILLLPFGEYCHCLVEQLVHRLFSELAVVEFNRYLGKQLVMALESAFAENSNLSCKTTRESVSLMTRESFLAVLSRIHVRYKPFRGLGLNWIDWWEFLVVQFQDSDLD